MAKVEPAPVEPTLETLGEYIDVKAAAAAVNVNRLTILRAIRAGELPAFVPHNRVPRFAGRGMGYRIHPRNLERWYFGNPKA